MDSRATEDAVRQISPKSFRSGNPRFSYHNFLDRRLQRQRLLFFASLTLHFEAAFACFHFGFLPNIQHAHHQAAVRKRGKQLRACTPPGPRTRHRADGRSAHTPPIPAPHSDTFPPTVFRFECMSDVLIGGLEASAAGRVAAPLTASRNGRRDRIRPPAHLLGCVHCGGLHVCTPQCRRLPAHVCIHCLH